MSQKTPEEEAEETLRRFADAPIGLCYLDRDLRYRYINKWLADVNGVSPERHLGKTIHEIIKDVADQVVPQLRRVLETGEPIIDGEAEAATRATPGEQKVFRHSYHPALNTEGEIVGVSCVVQDITELRRDKNDMHDSLVTIQSVHDRLEKVLSLLPSPPGGIGPS